MLDVRQYTIDAGHEGVTASVAAEAVDRCEEFNFARIINVYDDEGFSDVSSSIDAYLEATGSLGFHQAAGSRKNRYVVAAAKPYVAGQKYEGVIQATQPIADALHEAGRNSERMATPNSDIKLLQANVYQPGGGIEPHYDGRDGVAVVFGREGLVRTTLSVARTGRFLTRITDIADFGGAQNELLVMPAEVGDRGGAEDQIWHRMANITPEALVAGGIRKSAVIVYGSARPHNLTELSQARQASAANEV